NPHAPCAIRVEKKERKKREKERGEQGGRGGRRGDLHPQAATDEQDAVHRELGRRTPKRRRAAAATPAAPPFAPTRTASPYRDLAANAVLAASTTTKVPSWSAGRRTSCAVVRCRGDEPR
ncbi:unnamed protein product, partial [Urochloa humidicola]